MKKKNSILMAGLIVLGGTLSFAAEMNQSYLLNCYNAIISAFEAGQLSVAAEDGNIEIIKIHKALAALVLAHKEESYNPALLQIATGFFGGTALVGGIVSVGDILSILSRPENGYTIGNCFQVLTNKQILIIVASLVSAGISRCFFNKAASYTSEIVKLKEVIEYDKDIIRKLKSFKCNEL